MNNTAALLHVQDLRYQYAHSDWALHIPAFSLHPGELKAVIGPNGSGKSTFLKCIAGIAPAKTGGPRIHATPVHQMPRKEIARWIGYLPQHLPGDFNYRVDELIAMGRYPHLKGGNFLEARDCEVLKHCMEITDTLSLAQRHIFQLSGGERQRVFLASVLAQEPSILLFDEPTNALDIHHQAAFLKIVLELSRKGIAIVLVTHDMNLASTLSNRILLLHQGNVVMEGAPDEVLNASVLESVYGDELYFTEHPLMKKPWVLPKFDTAGNDIENRI